MLFNGKFSYKHKTYVFYSATLQTVFINMPGVLQRNLLPNTQGPVFIILAEVFEIRERTRVNMDADPHKCLFGEQVQDIQEEIYPMMYGMKTTNRDLLSPFLYKEGKNWV